MVPPEELEPTTKRLRATIFIVLNKPMHVIFRVIQKFDKGSVFLRPLNFPSFRTSRVVEVKSELGDEQFLATGIQHAIESSKSMCESEYYFEYIEPKKMELNV